MRILRAVTVVAASLLMSGSLLMGAGAASAGDVAPRSCDLTADAVSCPRADLSGQDLRAYDLMGAVLHHADLRGVVHHRGSMALAVLHHADRACQMNCVRGVA